MIRIKQPMIKKKKYSRMKTKKSCKMKWPLMTSNRKPSKSRSQSKTQSTRESLRERSSFVSLLRLQRISVRQLLMIPLVVRLSHTMRICKLLKMMENLRILSIKIILMRNRKKRRSITLMTFHQTKTNKYQTKIWNMKTTLIPK